MIVPRVLVAVGAVLAVASILALWVSRQALETDQWTDTSSELLEQPAVRAAVAGFLVDQLYANVDVEGQLRAALPPVAEPLAGPAAGALRTSAETVALRALERPEVQRAWEDANREAHRLLVDVVEGGNERVRTEDGTVTLQLKALLAELERRTGVGGRAARALPESAAQVTVLRSDQLRAAQTVGRGLKPLALLLVLAMLACFAAAVWLARDRRRETIRACGIALVLAGVAALVVRALLGDAVVGEVATTAAVEPAARAVWNVGTSLLTGVAVASIVYGAVAIAGTALAGPSRFAVAARRVAAPYAGNLWAAYGAFALVVLLVVLWGPTEGTRRALPGLTLLLLAGAGFEALRRRTLADRPVPAFAGPAASADGAAPSTRPLEGARP